jgi:hypothetical protein
MPEFKPHERSLNSSWLIAQINRLIGSAKNFSDSSLVIYAALETRNLFERLEYELLGMAAKGTETEEFLKGIRGRTGIQQTNKKYKVLKYRYQSFSSAATKAIFEGGALNKFDYKRSEQYCGELSQYIHTYSRMPEDMLFSSDFIRSGIELVEECINYLMTEFFEIIDGGLTYGVFDFNTLTPSVRQEFENWLNGVDENEEELLKRLSDINNRENEGVKTRISFD